MLEPLLFVIYINGLDENIGSWYVCTFADNTKIVGAVDSQEDCPRIQRDIDHLKIWAEGWQMEFNPGKWEVMYWT